MTDVTEKLILPFFAKMGLAEHLKNSDVSEIMITNGLVFVDIAGQLRECPATVDEKSLRACVEIVANTLGDFINDHEKPWLDARLPDGSRLAATYPPVSPQGVVLTIRKFLRHFTTDELVERGSNAPELRDLMLKGIYERKNFLFAGGTSTGKTTQVNAAVMHIPDDERLVVIEKPMEMKIHHRNAVRFEACPRVADRPEVTISQILSFTLRHRPDRIIVGEVKDYEAAFGLLQAMNTGHDGTFSTIHANTAELALNRLAALALPGFGSLDLSRQETAAAIDFVVEVKRLNGWRGVTRLLQVDEYDPQSRVFRTTELYRRQAA